MAKTIRTPGQEALIAELIRARTEAGLTQSTLAKAVRCQQSLIARIEGGERRIDVVELAVLARVTGADLSVILARVAAAVLEDHGL